MTSTTKKSPLPVEQTEESIKWDQAEKGYLTDAERIAKNMDVDGKGHLSREQSVSLGAQFQSLKEDNKQIKKNLYGLAVLCVLLFIGTVVGTVVAVRNSKDTIVDMETGVMKVKDGSDEIVTVQAQGTTFQTTGSVMMNEETTTDGETFTKIMAGNCVASDDIASMWLANEKGTDARLVITDDTDNVSSIEPVTTGRASWNKDHIVMGGMTFIPNEECTSSNRRKLLESKDIEDNDMPSFDSISIHRALKERVGFLSGRRLQDTNSGATSTSYAVKDRTVVAVRNSKDTIVDMETGVMKVKDGSDEIVTVQAQGTTFQTTGSVMMNEETTTDGETFTKIMAGNCVASDDIASMWLANEKGTDARLVITDDTDNVSSIEPVTTGRASWNKDHIVMGGMTFIPNEECTSSNRRKLLESKDIEDNDMPSFDSISIHRALKERVGFLSGRRLQDTNSGATSTSYAVKDRTAATDPDPVNLGDAGNFAILSKAGITNLVTSTITGDIAVSPIAATAMTGFGLTADGTNEFSTSTEVVGKVYAANYAVPTPTKLSTAVSNMETAYIDTQGRTQPNEFYNNINVGEIGGLELTKGVYIFSTGVTIGKSIRFSGSATDIFIIKTSNDLTQTANTKVLLADGALAKNIFWSVAGKVVVQAGAHMEGTLLVKTSATFITGSSLNGRVLSQTAVALDQNTITAPSASALTQQSGSSPLRIELEVQQYEYDIATILYATTCLYLLLT